MFLGALQIAMVHEHAREFVVDDRVAGIEAQELLVAEDRLLLRTGLPVGVGEIDHGVGVVGLQLDRSPVTLDRGGRVIVAQLLVAEPDPRVDHRRVLDQHPFEGFHRRRPVPLE